MRTRGEIDEEIAESNAEHDGRDTVALLQLELLMDIRDLLIDLYNPDADVKIESGLKRELFRRQREAGK